MNAEAWRYLTLSKLAERARAYVVYRGVDVSGLEILEDTVGGPLVGHTPKSPTGLVDQLRRAGFTEDEMVDAGWAARRTGDVPAAGVIIDRFRARVMVPFRTGTGEVVGVAARAVSWAEGDRRPKYLNHPRTVVFDRSEVLYRPTEHQVDRRGSAVVVEGTLDALAIAAAAAAAGMSEHFAPVSQSGLNLTRAVAQRVAAISARPPIVCGDPDPSGQAATARWATSTMTGLHREVLAVTLPAGMDPLDWLRREGPVGLLAFSSYGLIDDGRTAPPRPRSAGALVATRELDAALDAAQPATRCAVEHEAACAVVGRLRQLTAHVSGEAAQRRFAHAAAAVLAERVAGRPLGWYVDQIAGSSTTSSMGISGIRPSGEAGVVPQRLGRSCPFA
ncbi:toprim domain-containing protein [Nocardioides hankookensis]|uniref:Toprim domain-containing protein n=1 Tax=Nocardioides hankookensis TaxID=443157 RepID=A0ABW1LHT5_9ACTN